MTFTSSQLGEATGLLVPALAGGWTAQLPRAVPGGPPARVNAFDAMTFGAAGLAGPALAGGVAEALGAPAAVLVAGVLIGLAVPAAWRLPGAPGGREAGVTVGDLVAGARFVLGDPALARATLTSAGCCVAQGMLTACVPLLGERALGGAARGAMLLSCAAASGLAANAVLARRAVMAPDAVIRTSALVQAAALALAASGRPAVLVVAALLAGAGEGPQLTALFTVRHRESPDHLRGRISTTGASLKTTGLAVGAALAGPLAGRSLSGTLLLASGVAAAAGLRGARSAERW
ncbi:MFS transporter [Streptomyces sp. NPDC058459]|uniref:MFS transporter n=1 Tax=Streptomyces sp. NPDC058459 TaxID=3346508 RepID=UPI003651A4E1